MCRLAYVPPGTPVTGKTLGLLEHLAATQGRDGVGVGTWVPNKGWLIVKGVDAKVPAIVKSLGEAPRGIMFHARLATSGPKVDALCQPFAFDDLLAVHNGGWSDWKEAFWGLMASGGISPTSGPFNDSSMAAAMAAKAGRFVLEYIDSGVFITWREKERWPIVTVRRGDFAYSSAPGAEGGIIYASSFPENWPVQVMEFTNNCSAVLTPAGPYLLYGDKPFVGVVRSYSYQPGRGYWGGVA